MKNKFILIVALLCSAFASKAQTVLTPDDFEKKLTVTKDAQLIDVRTPGEYKEGHLKSSKNIDYKDQAFKGQIAKLDKNKPVFVYCLAGGRSAAAAELLHQNGFTEVYDMKGGYLKWNTAGKAVDGVEASSVKSMTLPDFKKITTGDKIVLIDFYAKWCAPCVKMLPTVHKLTEEYKGKAKIQTINYDQNKALAKEMGIDELPAFLLYIDGKLVKRVSGELTEAQFRKLLEG